MEKVSIAALVTSPGKISGKSGLAFQVPACYTKWTVKFLLKSEENTLLCTLNTFSLNGAQSLSLTYS